MARQKQKEIAPQPRDRDEQVQDVAPAVGEAAVRLKAELDDLLDDIDGVLEENAEDFVKSYIQKGGE